MFFFPWEQVGHLALHRDTCTRMKWACPCGLHTRVFAGAILGAMLLSARFVAQFHSNFRPTPWSLLATSKKMTRATPLIMLQGAYCMKCIHKPIIATCLVPILSDLFMHGDQVVMKLDHDLCVSYTTSFIDSCTDYIPLLCFAKQYVCIQDAQQRT